DVEAQVVMRSTLSDRLTKIISDALGLPEKTLQITLGFGDAQTNEDGFQAAATVEFTLGYALAKKFSIDDLKMDGLGTYAVDENDTNNSQITLGIGGSVTLGFGFNIATLTPYLLKSTSINLSAGLDASVHFSALGGSVLALDGFAQLSASKKETKQ